MGGTWMPYLYINLIIIWFDNESRSYHFFQNMYKINLFQKNSINQNLLNYKFINRYLIKGIEVYFFLNFWAKIYF